MLPHRQAYTSIDQARALGVDAGGVLKTLALRTESRYALLVIPASRRLDLHLAREAVGDHQARLATEEELVRDFAGYELGALPPLAGLVDAEVYVDPEVLRHDTDAFAAGTQTESVKLRPGEPGQRVHGHGDHRRPPREFRETDLVRMTRWSLSLWDLSYLDPVHHIRGR